MRNSIPILGAALAVCVAVPLTLRQHVLAAQAQVEALRAYVAKAPETVVAAPTQVAAPTPAVEPVVAPPPKSVPTAASSAPPCEREPPSAGSAERQQRQLRLRENPEYHAARRDMMRIQMTVSRIDAKAILHWSDADMDKLIDLVADQRVRQEDATNFMVTTPEEIKDARRKRAELDKQFDEERKALLGEEKFREWKAYRESIDARNEVYDLRAQLAVTAQPLREDQIEPLVAALNKEFQAVKAEIDDNPSNPFSPNAAVTSPEDSAKYLDRLTAANERIHDAAALILSDEQLQYHDRIRARDLARDRATIDLNRVQRDVTQRLQSASTN